MGRIPAGMKYDISNIPDSRNEKGDFKNLYLYLCDTHETVEVEETLTQVQ